MDDPVVTDATMTTRGRPGRATSRPGMRQQSLRWLATNSLGAALVLMVVVFQLTTGSLLDWPNVRTMLLDSAVVAVVAVPLAILMIGGYVDLSVGSTMALGGVLAGKVVENGHGSVGVAVLLAVAVGLAVGLFNGVVAVRFGLSAIIVTLGTLTAVRGVAQLVSPFVTSTFGSSFQFLGNGLLAGIPVPVLIAAGALVIGAYFLSRTAAGRHVYAIGVNPDAAFLSGVSVRRLPFLLFLACGACAGLAGAITAARLNSAPAGQLGVGFELTVLTAVLLGGVSFKGGEGNMLGVLLGVLFLAVLNNGLILLGVETFWQSVASGLALVGAVGLSALTHRVNAAAAARAGAARQMTTLPPGTGGRVQR